MAGALLQGFIRALVARSAALDAAAAQTAQVPIDGAEFTALRLLAGTDSLRMRDIAEAMRIPASSATDLADRLVDKHLVERGTDPADRRVVRLALSRRGRRVWSDAEAAHAALCAEMLERLEPAERAALVSALGRLMEPVA